MNVDLGSCESGQVVRVRLSSSGDVTHTLKAAVPSPSPSVVDSVGLLLLACGKAEACKCHRAGKLSPGHAYRERGGRDVCVRVIVRMYSNNCAQVRGQYPQLPKHPEPGKNTCTQISTKNIRSKGGGGAHLSLFSKASLNTPHWMEETANRGLPFSG